VMLTIDCIWTAIWRIGKLCGIITSKIHILFQPIMLAQQTKITGDY